MAAKPPKGVGHYPHLDNLTAADYRDLIRANRQGFKAIPLTEKKPADASSKNTPASRSQSSISGRIDTRKKELFDLVVRKTGLTMNDVFDSYAEGFIRQNADLLTASERHHFEDFFTAET